MPEMRRRNSPSSLVHTPPGTPQPPRKRPRTAEHELSPTADSNPAPSPKSSAAVTASPLISVPLLSTPPPTSPPRSGMSMSHMVDVLDVLDTGGVQMGAPTSGSALGSRSAPRSGVSHIVANESDPDAEGSATLLDGFSSIFGGEGDAGGAPPSMRSRRKGKAKANNEGSDGEGAMSSEPIQSDTKSNPRSGQVATEADTAGVITKPPFPTQPQHIVDDIVEPTVRDGEFYIDSADCVIRVDNTFFRVHRYFLGRDSSAFQHMFSLPTQDRVPLQNMEGWSDENPIRLYGESVERFRTLLSVIYDLPPQLQIYNTPAANIDQLLTIAEMANKYHFTSTETWAVDALYNVVSGLHGPPQAQYDLGHCSSAWMKRLLETALLCGHTALRNRVADEWVGRIVTRDLRPVHALEIADRSSIRRLQGYAYYVQLLEMDENFDPGVVEDGEQYSRSATALAVAGPNGNGNDANGTSASARTGTPASLTREQRERLIFGHWSLSQLWDKLRTNPPKWEQQAGCTNHQQGCLSAWKQVWRDVGKSEATLKHPLRDVLSRLRTMERQLFMTAEMLAYLWRALTPQCRQGAVGALQATIKEVQEGLADHFAPLTHMQSNAAEGE